MTLIADYIKHENEYIKRYGPKTMFLMQCGSFFEVYCCKKWFEFYKMFLSDASNHIVVR